MIWSSFGWRGKKKLVGVAYRAPNSSCSVGKGINQQIIGASEKNRAIIMGDFNLQIHWVNQVGKGNYDNKFIECITNSFHEQYVMEPTSKRAILDLGFTQRPNMHFGCTTSL